jgi:hypothetical protein
VSESKVRVPEMDWVPKRTPEQRADASNSLWRFLEAPECAFCEVKGDFGIKKGHFGVPEGMRTYFRMNGLSTSLMFVALVNEFLKHQFSNNEDQFWITKKLVWGDNML